MASIGPFEATRELQSSAEGSVWEGTGPDGRAVTIVVLGPFEDSLARLPTGDDVKAFLDAISIQRVVSAEAGSAWVKVLDLGRTARGAFAAFEQHRRSVQQLVEVRATVDATDLGVLVRDLVSALRELQDKGIRSHGNIEADRVLLRGGQLSEGVLLTRPEAGAATASVAGDLERIGRLVYRLVMRREFEPLGGWPIEKSAEWLALGAGGDRIRTICDRFLDPNLAKTRPALEIVQKEVGKPAGRRSRMPVLVAVGLVAVAGLVGAGYFAMGGGGKGPDVDPGVFDPIAWKRLCWSVELVKDAGLWEGGEKLGERDEELRRIAEGLARHTWFGTLADRPGTFRQWQSEESSAASLARRKHAGEVAGMVEDLRAAIDSLSGWGGIARLKEHAASLKGRGWERSAQECEEAAAALERETARARRVVADLEGDAQLEDPIVRALDAIERAERAGVMSADIEAARRLAAGDPLLVPVGERLGALAGQMAATSLDALPGRLEPLSVFAKSLVAFGHGDWQEVDREALPPVDVSAAGVRELDAWIVTARSYLPVTAGAPELSRRTAALDAVGRHVEEVRGAMRELDDMGERAAHDGIAAKLVELERRAGVLEEMRGVASNLGKIGAESEAIERDAAVLAESATREAQQRAQARAVQRWDDMTRLLNAHREQEPASGEPAVSARWRTMVDEVLGRDPALPGLSQSITRGQELNQNLRDRFADLESLASAFPAPGAFAGVAGESIRAAAEAERTERMASALASLRVVDGLGAWARDANGKEQRLVEAESYSDFLAGARDLAVAVQRMDTLLGFGYGPDDRPEGDSLSEATARAEALARALGRDEIDAVIAAAAAPVRELEVIAGASRSALTDRARAVASLPGAQRVAVWRALGRASPSWPATSAELASERALVKGIREAMAGTDRGVWIADELGRDVSRRLDGYLAAPERTIEEIVGVRDAAMELEVQLSWGARFEIAWAEFRGGFTAGSDGSAAIDRAVAMRAQLGDPPAELDAARRGRVLALYAGIADAQRVMGEAGNARPLDPAALGPGAAAGWAGEVLGDGERLRYRKSFGAREEVIEFKLVSEGVETPVYIATTEASIGLCAEVLGAGPLAGWSWRGEDERDPLDDEASAVPVGWSIEGGRVVPSRTWLRPLPVPDSGEVLYAEGLRGMTPAGLGLPQREPTAESPMQYIRPAEALLMARRLGCRFPTEEEWRAALDGERGARSVASYIVESTANLSDATFRRQLEYVASQVAAGKIPFQGCYPYAGSVSEYDRETLRNAWDEMPGYDDGVLWFRVPPGRGDGAILDLVGNVAEFTCDRAAEAEAIPASTGEVERFLATARVGAVGGSSVMDVPDLEFAARPIASPAEGLYADVGVRLAFGAAQALGPAQRAPRILRDAVRAFGDRL